jgi:hypothetical protein
MATRATAPDSSTLNLERITKSRVQIPIEGLSPLIPHRWSVKALQMMRDKQFAAAGTTRPKREPKDPVDEAEMASYWLPDGRPGMPATAFKSAIVESARYFDGVTITLLKRIIIVEGIGDDMLVPIVGEKALREDTPRNASGVADLRYRYAWMPWSAVLTVQFVPKLVTVNSVIALVDAAGQGGVGDWRPGAPKSNTGVYGTFHIPGSFLSSADADADASKETPK